MASALLDLFYSMGNCLSCFPSSPQLKINSRSFKILRLLGEVCVQPETVYLPLLTAEL
jgi:serine/threonine kinase 16